MCKSNLLFEVVLSLAQLGPTYYLHCHYQKEPHRSPGHLSCLWVRSSHGHSGPASQQW